MTPMHLLAVGFVLGAVTVGLALLAIVGRYKWENLRARSLFDAMNLRLRQSEQQRAQLTQNLIVSNAENAYLKGETERLRNEKLHGWDIPDSL